MHAPDDWFDMEVVHSSGSGAQWANVKYCWSGVYLKDDTNPSQGWKWKNAEDYDYLSGSNEGVHTDEPERDGRYWYPAFHYDYYICTMYPAD